MRGDYYSLLELFLQRVSFFGQCEFQYVKYVGYKKKILAT